MAMYSPAYIRRMQAPSQIRRRRKLILEDMSFAKREDFCLDYISSSFVAKLFIALCVVMMVVFTVHYQSHHQRGVHSLITRKLELEEMIEACQSSSSSMDKQISMLNEDLQRRTALTERNEATIHHLEFESQRLRLFLEIARKEIKEKSDKIEALNSELGFMRLVKLGQELKYKKEIRKLVRERFEAEYMIKREAESSFEQERSTMQKEIYDWMTDMSWLVMCYEQEDPEKVKYYGIFRRLSDAFRGDSTTQRCLELYKARYEFLIT